MTDWPRKITLSGTGAQILVVDDEVSRLIDERSAYWAAHPRTHAERSVITALREIVWAGRRSGVRVDLFGNLLTGGCLKLRRVDGECSVCGGQNGNHYPWCGHA